MQRRGFFKSISGLFAIAAIDPSSLLAPAPPGLAFAKDAFNVSAIDLPHPESIKGQFQLLTRYMHEELVRQVGEFPELGPVSNINMEFQNQYGIDMRLDRPQLETLSDDQLHKHYVAPLVALMADEIKLHAKRFGRLPIPDGLDRVARAEGSGVSLRGLGMYDIQGSPTWDPGWIYRFDVLFASA